MTNPTSTPAELAASIRATVLTLELIKRYPCLKYGIADNQPERDSLRAKVERLKARESHHRDLGITLLDAKWLDPECHKGCKSLVLKSKLAAAERDTQRLDWVGDVIPSEYVVSFRWDYRTGVELCVGGPGIGFGNSVRTALAAATKEDKP